MSYQISGTPLHNSYLDFSIIGNIIIQNVDLNIGAKMIKIIKGCKELSTFIKDAIKYKIWIYNGNCMFNYFFYGIK